MKRQLGLGLALLLAGAAATAAPVARIRGTIEKVGDDVIEVRTRSGESVLIKIPAEVRVAGATKAAISDVKPDSYVGTAAVPQPDGSLRALEVTVFAPTMRGAGEGHYPWDLEKESTMTNGVVGDMVGSTGRTITVKYKGGEKTIAVPDDVPVVSLAPADRSIIEPGASVVVFAKRDVNGAPAADRLVVGRDGTVPPM